MPTRRIMLLALATEVLARPVLGSVRLWSVKTMAATTPGTFVHVIAEVAAILT